MNGTENGAKDTTFVQNDTAFRGPEESIELAVNIDEVMGETGGRNDAQTDT